MASRLSPHDVAQWLFTMGPSIIQTEHRNALQAAIIRGNIDGPSFTKLLQSRDRMLAIAPFRLPVIYKLRKYWEQEITAGDVIRVDQRVAGGHDRYDDRPTCLSRPIILDSRVSTQPWHDTKPRSESSQPYRNQAQPMSEQSQPYRSDVSRGVSEASQSLDGYNGEDTLITVELLAATVDFICEKTRIDRNQTYASLEEILPDQVYGELRALHVARTNDHSYALPDTEPHRGPHGARTDIPAYGRTENHMHGHTERQHRDSRAESLFPNREHAEKLWHEEAAQWLGDDREMAEWIGIQGDSAGPMECARWIRSLPSKIPDREKKILASVVLREGLHFADFEGLLQEQNVVKHHIQGAVLKFIAQRRREQLLSRAAADTMEENKLFKKRGEMLTC